MNKEFRKQLTIDLATVVIGYLVLGLLIRSGVINAYSKGILLMVCINVILTVSLNITSGFLGELALGHAGFMAIGAYVSALFTKSLNLIPLVEFPVAILLGGIAALIAGYIVSIPALRLRGDYLAIITLAAGEIIRNLLKNLDIVGGTKGYTGIPNYTSFTWAYLIAVICILASKSLIASRHGRAIISIREDEIAAEASGIDTNRYKIIGFVFSAFFAGVGGALYAHYLRFLQPGIFTLDKSIEILVMVVLGGMGSIRGSVISATILTVLPELLRGFSDYRMLVYSLVLILMMLAKHNDQLRALFDKALSSFRRKEAAHE
ncbi:MAG: branched-chain amino acid ABC transporter permease [Erysipelotrichaceae bacterium]|nr:branched-chain amino acid ABC transporter permease [Erysipelotrichaceae bacterium]